MPSFTQTPFRLPQPSHSAPVKLGAEVATCLESYPEYFIPKSAGLFSYDLSNTGTKQWHVLDDTLKGKGSFGKVYPSTMKITVEESNGKSIAKLEKVDDVVKIQIKPEDMSFEEFKLRVIAEAKKQRNQGVKVHAVVQTKDSMITVTENCGITLTKLFEKFQQNPDHYDFNFRYNIAKSIVNEISILQQKNQVHRDLKPDNICCKQLPDGRFQVYIIDFGLATDADSLDNFESPGTPPYMAPEILIDHDISSYDSDMFSLSGILAQLFGANNIFKDRRSNLAAKFCLDGLFQGYEMNHADDVTKHDLTELMSNLANRQPYDRPRLATVTKFFNIVSKRLETYCVSKKQLDDEVQEFMQNCRTLGITDKRNKLRNAKKSVFNSAIISNCRRIFDLLNGLPKPSTTCALELASALIKDKRTVDEAVRYDDLTNVLIPINVENEKLSKTIRAIEELQTAILRGNNFFRTNSTGMQDIIKILNYPSSLGKKLKKLHEIGRKKSNSVLSMFSKSQCFFGRGRHENIDTLYRRLANLNVNPSSDYIAIEAINSIRDFINQTQFVHPKRSFMTLS